MTKRFTVLCRYEQPTDDTKEYKKIPYGVRCTAYTKDCTYQAEATAQGDDVFNEELGRKLAEAKVDYYMAQDRFKWAKRKLKCDREDALFYKARYDRSLKREGERAQELIEYKEKLDALLNQVK